MILISGKATKNRRKARILYEQRNTDPEHPFESYFPQIETI